MRRASSHPFRRGGAAAVGGLFAALALAPAASADETIEATFPTRYNETSVTIDQGERLTFRNLDIADHDVVSTGKGSDGKALFSTPLIGTAEESFVEGSQFLTTGHYDFFCSIHANMQGTLHVSTAGTPVPRPGGGSAGGGGGPNSVTVDKVKPRIRVKLRSTRASRVRRARELVVEVTASEAAKVALVAKAKRRTIATGAVELTTAGKRRPELRLTRAGRRLVKRGRRVRVSISARAIDFSGNVSRASARGTLRR